MPTNPAFRLSTYLTLAFACASLGYAETPLFPAVGVFAGIVVIFLAVVYHLETRIALLSMPAANKLGGGIALIGLIWAGSRIAHEVRLGQFTAMSWSAFLVALLAAPILMAAIPAKLLRQEKDRGDYWFLHAAALGAVALAQAMDESVIIFLLTLGYAVCGVWSLAQFFLARLQAGISVSDSSAIAVNTGAGPRAGVKQALVWTIVAAVATAPLYLVTPRSGYARVGFGQQRIETGYATDQMIDLNLTGNLETNTEVAFEVIAEENDGRPKEDLNPGQRWRGAVLSLYTNGQWHKESGTRLPPISRTITRPDPWFPPDLGPDQYRLTFTTPRQLRSQQFLAEPVAWAERQPSPVATLLPDHRFLPWYPLPDGAFYWIGGSGSSTAKGLQYVQHTRPPIEPDLSPRLKITGNLDRGLTLSPFVRIKAYADEVLAIAIREGRLPAKVRDPDPVHNRSRGEYHELIAREFTRHLSGPAGLTYSTELRRQEKGVDPVEDFLFNSKAGHCERFATALVLMLRSEGIPAVMVLGFQGADHRGRGRYEIRQDQAHAWVEALISRPRTPPIPPDLTDPQPSQSWHWLSLDPSPAQSRGGTSEVLEEFLGEGTVSSSAEWLKRSFNRYFVRYSENHRERTIRDILDWFSSLEALGIIGLVAIGLVARWILLRRAVARTPPAPEMAEWFGHLLAVLAIQGYAPEPGDTPREFATRMGNCLRQRPATRDVADVPVEWVEANYSVRFGGNSLSNEQQAHLDVRLNALRDVLTGNHKDES